MSFKYYCFYSFKYYYFMLFLHNNNLGRNLSNNLHLWSPNKYELCGFFPSLYHRAAVWGASYVNCFYASKISNLPRTINLLIITFSFCFLLFLYGLLSTRSAYFHRFSLYFAFSQISPNCKGLKGHLRCIVINILVHDNISN